MIFGNPGASRRIDRRAFLASLAALTAMRLPARAEGEAAAAKAQATEDPGPQPPSAQFEEAFARIVGSGTPLDGRMTIELPEDAENGNIVPYKISAESPMTAEDHVARVHLLSTLNPQASVATFHFTPLSGKAVVSGRMRLAKTQDVVAVAVTSANVLLVARQTVIVGIGGCGTE
ncbi:MAG: thiosulfate oxidation carrier protein SoxY [Hyphomicrobium sp.]|uniref:thiosulfate oxidation carrier protein SoxY n=1 Tax=Hyphomicrobium sp. TaxID=82 RepID=UPI003D0ED2B4